MKMKSCWLILVSLAMGKLSLQAADVIKANNADNLNNITSWVGGIVPTSADVAVWNNTVTGPNTVLLGSDTNWAGIRIANPAGAVIISAGNTLTNGAAGIDMSLSTVDLTLNQGVSLGAAQSWNVGSGVTLTAGGIVSGANRLTKDGNGTLILGAANNYSGGTVLNTGIVQANNGTSFGAAAGGITNNNGSTLRINVTTSIANPVNFNGIVTIDLNNFGNNEALTGSWSGSGTVNVINQQNTAGRVFTMGGSSANWSGFTGTVNVGTNGQSFRFNDGGGSGNTGNSQATMDLGTGLASFLTRNRGAAVNFGVLLGGPGTKVINGSSSSGISTYSIGGKNVPCTFDGAFVDAGLTAGLAITKVGTSTFTLTGTNRYVGATTVSAGTLQVGTGGTAGQLGSGAIVNNAALVFNRSDAIVISNAISGSGTFTVQGGTVATFQGTNTSSGALVVTAGAADVGVSGSIQCPILLSNGTFLIVTNNPTFTLNQTLSGVGTVDSGLTAVGGTVSPGAVGNGGTLAFLNNFTNSGTVTYQMELATAGPSDLVSVTGDFTVTGTNSIIASKLGGGTLALGTYPLINYTGNFNGGLSNFTVTLVGVTGTLTNPPNQIALIVTPAARGATNLTWVGDGGANSWDNNVSTNWVNGLAQFKFQAGDSVRFDLNGSINPTVNLNSAVLQPAAVVVDAANNYTLTGIGSISGSAALTKTNSGKLTLQTTNAYNGPTTVGAGTLEIANVANGNSPSPIGASTSSPTNWVFFNGSTLLYSGSDASTDRGATLNGANVIVDVATANLTFNGSQIVGAGALNKAGGGTLTLSVPNGYSGGTVLSNGVLALGANIANNDGVGGSALGSTNNPVTFRGGTLQLFGYNGGTGNNYSTVYNPLIVPAGEFGTLRMFPRGPANSGGNAGLQSSLTGSGTLNLVVHYVRDDLSGNWSGFTGLIDVTARNAADEMRINNNFGYANATINLNDGVTLCRSFTADTINDIGTLTGSSLSVVGPGNSSGARTTWRVGGLNADATFAGTLADDAGSTVIKVGSGTWTLSGAVTVGSMIVSNGAAVVTSSLSSTNIRVAAGAFLDVSAFGTLSLSTGQLLGGNGTVRGGVDTSGGGTIAPGFSIGTLAVTNGATLGGTVKMEVNRNGGSPISDKLTAPSIAMGGTLRVVRTGLPLQIGDTFDLFDGALSGGFSTFILGYNTWDLSQLAVNGTIKVTGILPPPNLNLSFNGTDLTLTSAGGIPGGDLTVVTSTDVTLPLDAWTTVQNDVFDGSGNYTVILPVDFSTPRRFYAIRAF